MVAVEVQRAVLVFFKGCFECDDFTYVYVVPSPHVEHFACALVSCDYEWYEVYRRVPADLGMFKR